MKQAKTLLTVVCVLELILQIATVVLFVGLSRFEKGWQWIPVGLFLLGSVCLLHLVRTRLSFRAALLFCFLASTGFAVLLEVFRWTLFGRAAQILRDTSFIRLERPSGGFAQSPNKLKHCKGAF